jgi:RsiW-degrading membrane proteinase PrsW (M82 family)
MRYFYYDQNGQQLGPYTMEELRQLHLNGVVKPDTMVVPEGSDSRTRFQELWANWRAQGGGGSGAAQPIALVGEFAQETTRDLRALVPHLLMPLKELKDFHWIQNRKLLAVAGIGLLPLIIYAAFADYGDIKTAFWAIAFYFSALWAMFFFYVFPSPEVRVGSSAICFFGTGVISISVLLLAYRMPPLKQLFELTGSSSTVWRLLGYVFGVGLPEEACKVLMLFYVWKAFPKLAPQGMMFYGLMSGLGFGVYEGVNYQTGRNLRFASGIGEYYLLNLLRLTTLPFLHAIWTGMAGYFIGFARLYPQRRRGLLIVAIGLPALLHGLYDTFGTNLIGLGVALLSVLAVNLYLAKSLEFEKALTEQEQV